MNSTSTCDEARQDTTSAAMQRTIKNGIAAVIVGLLGGFGLVFSMLGGISLSPVPVFFKFSFPGTPAGWEALHLGMLMNGLMAILVGLVMKPLHLTHRAAAWISWGTIIAVWGNFCFYFFGMFAHNHGLTLGGNTLGAGNLAGALAFAPALVGAITLIIAMILLVKSPFRTAR